MTSGSKYNFSGATIKNIGSIGSNNTTCDGITGINCIGPTTVHFGDDSALMRKGVAKITIEYIDEKLVKEQIFIKSNDSPLCITVRGDCGEITTRSGKVIIEGGSGRVTTHSGKVNINGDALSCYTDSGNISIHGDVTGNCTNKSGDIKAGRISGYCTTLSGDITGKKKSW
jgi:hypothetical protein